MANKILQKCINNFEKDFGAKLPYPVLKYSQFERIIRSMLLEKEKNNQLREEELKTKSELFALQTRDFWKEMSHAFSFALIVITIVLTIAQVTSVAGFRLIAVAEGILLIPCAILAILCAKDINNRIYYYRFKLKIINEISKNQCAKKVVKLREVKI